LYQGLRDVQRVSDVRDLRSFPILAGMGFGCEFYGLEDHKRAFNDNLNRLADNSAGKTGCDPPAMSFHQL